MRTAVWTLRFRLPGIQRASACAWASASMARVMRWRAAERWTSKRSTTAPSTPDGVPCRASSRRKLEASAAVSSSVSPRDAEISSRSRWRVPLPEWGAQADFLLPSSESAVQVTSPSASKIQATHHRGLRPVTFASAASPLGRRNRRFERNASRARFACSAWMVKGSQASACSTGSTGASRCITAPQKAHFGAPRAAS